MDRLESVLGSGRICGLVGPLTFLRTEEALWETEGEARWVEWCPPHKRCVYLEPQGVILFGIRVFVDVVKVRLSKSGHSELVALIV